MHRLCFFEKLIIFISCSFHITNMCGIVLRSLFEMRHVRHVPIYAKTYRRAAANLGAFSIHRCVQVCIIIFKFCRRIFHMFQYENAYWYFSNIFKLSNWYIPTFLVGTKYTRIYSKYNEIYSAIQEQMLNLLVLDLNIIVHSGTFR